MGVPGASPQPRPPSPPAGLSGLPRTAGPLHACGSCPTAAAGLPYGEGLKG